jgi:RND family efflux transporter MFP subunit
MSAARVAIASAVSGLNTAVNTRNTAATSALTAKSQLDLQKAGSTQSDIDAQIAEVESQASLVAIKQAALSKNFLRSPIDGIVSKQDAKLGQIASAGVNIVSVISNSEFQIEANIPEASISKIQMGNLATVTLDAYQDSVKFNASIIRIDPAESIVDGVPTYKVTFEFVESDEKIRSGMTANIDIISAYKESALVIPQRAIYYDNEGSYVQVMRDGKPVLVRVEVGIRGSSGDTEILQGLSKDEEVIVNYK